MDREKTFADFFHGIIAEAYQLEPKKAEKQLRYIIEHIPQRSSKSCIDSSQDSLTDPSTWSLDDNRK